MVKNTAVSPRSLRLQNQFTQLYLHMARISGGDTPSCAPPPLPMVNVPKSTTKSGIWCATWNVSLDAPVYGRSFKNTPHGIYIQHWAEHPVSTPNSTLTPLSRPLVLSTCSGCSLHTPAPTFARGRHSNDERVRQATCLLVLPQDEVANLKDLFTRIRLPQPKHGVPSDLRIARFQINSLLRSTFISAPAPPVLSDSPMLNLPSHENSFTTGLFVSYNNNCVMVDKPVRGFIKSLHSAFNFHELLSLNRWSRIAFFNNRSMLDWTATWHLWNFKLCDSSLQSSFKYSARKAFSAKLLMDELPLLHRLQTARRPDLYSPDWNCILCHEDKETWTHLWQCNTLRPILQPLRIATKKAFENWIAADHPHASPIKFADSWHQLDVWSAPTDDTSLLTFDYLIRGFVPVALMTELSRHLNKSDALDAVGSITSTALDMFFEQAWKFRCREFITFEKSEGIDQKMKKTPFVSSRLLSSSNVSPPTHLSSDPNRWLS